MFKEGDIVVAKKGVFAGYWKDCIFVCLNSSLCEVISPPSVVEKSSKEGMRNASAHPFNFMKIDV